MDTMTINKPLVTIVIPTYGRSEMLYNAIDTVINQTYTNIEIIVVDDNQPDSNYRKENIEMINQIKDDRLVYIQREKNGGGSAARNTGIFSSNGDYITFLDDDDLYLENKVYNQIKYIEEGNYDVVFSNMIIKNKNGKVIDYKNYTDIKKLDNTSLLKYHLTKQITGTPTFMFKAEVIKEINGFDDFKMGQEYMLMHKTIKGNYKLGYLDSNDVIVNLHDGERISNSVNKINGQKQIYNFKRSHDKILNKFERNFIIMRHYLVLSVFHLRRKELIRGFFLLIFSLIISPIQLFKFYFRKKYYTYKIRGDV